MHRPGNIPTAARRCALFILAATILPARAAIEPSTSPPRVAVSVDAGASIQRLDPVWAFFGYDEPNYTYMKHGVKLLTELSALSPVPVYIRCHNLLTSGDGKPALKWGSTNAYTEDASGRAIYDWTIMDKIFDAYRDARVVPLVEIGFMPEALSIKPQPYRHTWPNGPFNTGWAFPPKDHAKWAELVYQWVRHAVERYGRAEVEAWLWELWNEPDIGYWQSSPEEYFKLYDYTADAVKRALPTARIGGPHSTSPGGKRAGEFLRRFLEHCASGTNSATGKTGAPLDFIGFHAKGSTRFTAGHVQMGIAPQLQSIARGFEIAAASDAFRNAPIIIGESDPEGGAARSARLHPENGYRNGPQYAAYTAAVFKGTYDLAREHKVNLCGAVTWAFEFEDQPYFDGFRSLATNGIDKPILNLFRMLGMMGGERLAVESDGALALADVLREGVRGKPDINALAARRDGEISVLVWNYHDDAVAAPPSEIALTFEHLPQSARRVLLRHYRIDDSHSNAFAAWKAIGEPQNPTPELYARLEAAGQLQTLASPQWRNVQAGRMSLDFALPRQGVSLVQIVWD